MEELIVSYSAGFFFHPTAGRLISYGLNVVNDGFAWQSSQRKRMNARENVFFFCEKWNVSIFHYR